MFFASVLSLMLRSIYFFNQVLSSLIDSSVDIALMQTMPYFDQSLHQLITAGWPQIL